jgi:methionyl-tRNA synthetase
MARKILVTSALPYANGPIHIGHLVEYIQTDIWTRYQKMCGNECLYFCADDTHGTPVMISAKAAGIEPEKLVEKVRTEHKADFDGFLIKFDNYYSTHSEENKYFSELIFSRINEAGSIVKRNIEQTWCDYDKMFLPDRFIRGTCPRCGSPDQYGDSCDKCGSTYQPTELKDARCASCGNPPVRRESVHYFFKLADYEKKLKDLMAGGYVQKTVANKLDEWFREGLKDWDISRDGPYFGFKIPGEENKFFYVWLDAPIGYLASLKNYCDSNGLDFDSFWPGRNPGAKRGEYEIYHFIGKDIMYFHALFWPTMLIGASFRTADKLFIHGFLTVNGEKMSKSKGTFIKASTYLKHLKPEALRYYYAGKIAGDVGDIDLSMTDFVNKINSDLVGKLANIASRSGPMLEKNFVSMLGQLDEEVRKLTEELLAARDEIIKDYENLDFASAIRKVNELADTANRYVERNQPWTTLKTDKLKTQKTLTTTINAARILTGYLKPVLPEFTEKTERFLNAGAITFDNIEKILENHKINRFERLFERINEEEVKAMTEESKENQSTASPTGAAPQPAPVAIEPIAPEITIEDFAKIDMRIARIVKAEKVEGADKLLRMQLDVGGLTRVVMAGIAKAYMPEQLTGKTVVYLANLKPRTMKFGVSEGMILASGSGGKEVFLLTADAGSQPGQRVS